MTALAPSLAHDLYETVRLTTPLTARRTLHAWLLTPLGIGILLAACWAVNGLLRRAGFAFPASVAMLLLLFGALVAGRAGLGERRMRVLVAGVGGPAGFALRYINVCFMPSFVLLPLSPAVGGVEVGKIAAVFLIGYVVVFAATAYLVRGLQILFGTSKKATTERAEEMGAENDEIPLTQRERPDPAFRRPVYSTHSHTDSLPEMPAPAQEPPHPRDPSSFALPPETPTQHTPTTTILRQDPLPPTRPQRWAASIATHLDTLTYLVLFLAIGLPTYYFLDYAMPAHLTLSVLAYFLASSLPRHTTRILHPVLVSSALTILAIYLLSRTTGTPLPQALSAYTTGTKYLTLFTPAPAPAGPARPRPLPGAGDVLGSLLDAGIAALALPMFQYRHELRRHLAAIAIPCTALAAASLFAYPALCAAVGIAPERSLAFAARSLTLALAGPAVANLGGDASLVAVLCIMSGILGVLVGPTLLTWLRIPDDDYVTRGVTMGGNSSAIATALLLVSDPRAAALSSLSMGLSGTVTVALTSVPPLVRMVVAMVGKEGA